ncbi:MAG: DUF302 domain-containing protein [Nitrospirae bacterium]|nr:DUF302 domain-containing protein [Nitrospirota bacterium]MBI3352610.1 DUF302 domain-containing protein [Nitrospirota bacterium]
MAKQDYGIRKTLNTSYEDAIPKVTEALKKEGFGILTEINVKETLKKKLDKDFKKYLIMGACNPSLAYQALSVETEMGLLLPCNVIIFETGPNQTVVSAQDPDVFLSIVGDKKELAAVAKEARERLARVIASL